MKRIKIINSMILSLVVHNNTDEPQKHWRRLEFVETILLPVHALQLEIGKEPDLSALGKDWGCDKDWLLVLSFSLLSLLLLCSFVSLLLLPLLSELQLEWLVDGVTWFWSFCDLWLVRFCELYLCWWSWLSPGADLPFAGALLDAFVFLWVVSKFSLCGRFVVGGAGFRSLLSVLGGGLRGLKYAVSLSMLFRTVNPYGFLTVCPSTERFIPMYGGTVTKGCL